MNETSNYDTWNPGHDGRLLPGCLGSERHYRNNEWCEMHHLLKLRSLLASSSRSEHILVLWLPVGGVYICHGRSDGPGESNECDFEKCGHSRLRVCVCSRCGRISRRIETGRAKREWRHLRRLDRVYKQPDCRS